MRTSPSNEPSPCAQGLGKPTVLLTMGDARGIGPEVIIRALSLQSIRRLADILVIGDFACLAAIRRSLNVKTPLKKIDLWQIVNSRKGAFNGSTINILDMGIENRPAHPLRYIDWAVMIMKGRKKGALVTAPVNKESIRKSGIRFTGHTEYLAHLTKSKRVAMMFVGERLKVTTVTRHIPFNRVGRTLTKEKIIDAALLTHDFLKGKFGLKRPKIGICALNPHAGEGGTLGNEERLKIYPALKYLRRKSPRICGPIPADSAFNLLYNGSLDTLIAMYHDQAMIPVKMLGRDECVNVTLGLPFVRTSPAHGTAYDIAGKNAADASGMIAAIRLACRLVRKA